MAAWPDPVEPSPRQEEALPHAETASVSSGLWDPDLIDYEQPERMSLAGAGEGHRCSGGHLLEAPA